LEFKRSATSSNPDDRDDIKQFNEMIEDVDEFDDSDFEFEDEEEAEEVDNQKSLFIFSQQNRFRTNIEKLTTWMMFEYFILFCIFVSCI